MTEDFRLANLRQQVMLRSAFSAFLLPRLDGALVCLCQLCLSHIREAENKSEAENISERLKICQRDGKYIREAENMSEESLKMCQRVNM